MKTGERFEMRSKVFANGVQLASELGVSTNYVYALRRAMGLTGRSRFIRRELVVEWLAAHPELTVRSGYENSQE